jgi:hypothetical protein
VTLAGYGNGYRDGGHSYRNFAELNCKALFCVLFSKFYN